MFDLSTTFAFEVLPPIFACLLDRGVNPPAFGHTILDAQHDVAAMFLARARAIRVVSLHIDSTGSIDVPIKKRRVQTQWWAHCLAYCVCPVRL